MREIHTERLTIDNVRSDEGMSIYDLIMDYRKSPFYPYDHAWPELPSDYVGIAKWFSSRDDYLAVRLKPKRELIGLINLTNGEGEADTTFNLGFIFKAEYQGKGYGLESCGAYITFIRSLCPKATFISGTAKANTPAQRLLRKLGFEVVKETRGSFQVDGNNNPIFFDGFEYFYTER